MSKPHYLRGDMDPNIEMDNLEAAFVRGDIDEKTFDEMMDELIEMANESSSATRAALTSAGEK